MDGWESLLPYDMLFAAEVVHRTKQEERRKDTAPHTGTQVSLTLPLKKTRTCTRRIFSDAYFYVKQERNDGRLLPNREEARPVSSRAVYVRRLESGRGGVRAGLVLVAPGPTIGANLRDVGWSLAAMGHPWPYEAEHTRACFFEPSNIDSRLANLCFYVVQQQHHTHQTRPVFSRLRRRENTGWSGLVGVRNSSGSSYQ